MELIKRAGAYFCYSVFMVFMACIICFELNPSISVPAFSKLVLCISGIFFLFIGSAVRTSYLKDNSEKQKTVRLTIWITFIIYVAYLMFLLFFDREYNRGLYPISNPSLDFATYFKLKTNFIPFKTITAYIKGWVYGRVYTNSLATNIIGNLIAFSPFGIFIPLLSKRLRSFWRFCLFILLVLSAVEAAQLLLMAGSCDIDDIILNYTGACVLYHFMQIKPIKSYFLKVGIEY